MATRTSGNIQHDVLAGRLLSYCDARDVGVVEDLTEAHPSSGLVVRNKDAVSAVARLREAHVTQPLVVDIGAWSNAAASKALPMRLPEGDGLFPPIGLDEWAAGIVARGATVVLTPSLFVRCIDWPTLRAVLRTGRSASAPQLRTLVATDAAMLDPAHLAPFLETLAAQAGERQLAFAFAGKSEPLARRGRIAGLRKVLARFPGSLVIAANVLLGTDVVAQGGAAAVGLTGGLRRPHRPWDTGGPALANGWVPALFLRQLWETRSPSTYADWFANSPSPTCTDCGGRALDGFSNHPADKEQVLRHNVHAWLGVQTEITRRRPAAAQDWLNTERCRGLAAHAAIRPIPVTLQADMLLRALCELDDPQQRRTTPTGQWR